MMLTRTLGKSGIEVSALGMGCWAIGGPWTWAQPGEKSRPAGWGRTDDAQSIQAIHLALEMGVTLFDTAANYGAGHSEIVLGRALRGRRQEVVIATKFGHIINEDRKVVYGDEKQILKNVRLDVENSLRRLQTDYIDIYQLHEGGFDPDPALELREILEDLVRQGKIRWYGWSTDLVDRAQVFAGGEHCATIQFQLNAIFDNPEMRQFCADFDLAGINKDPLNMGLLTGKFTAATTFTNDDVRSQTGYQDEHLQQWLPVVDVLREVLTTNGRTMAQGALAFIWALDPRMIPIPGFKTVQQVEDNAGAMAFGPLDESELEQVQDIIAEFKEDLAK
jgi:aryl-alcohol dehydrogenase-like predicted oxidoreductase